MKEEENKPGWASRVDDDVWKDMCDIQIQNSEGSIDLINGKIYRRWLNIRARNRSFSSFFLLITSYYYNSPKKESHLCS